MADSSEDKGCEACDFTGYHFDGHQEDCHIRGCEFSRCHPCEECGEGSHKIELIVTVSAGSDFQADVAREMLASMGLAIHVHMTRAHKKNRVKYRVEESGS